MSIPNGTAAVVMSWYATGRGEINTWKDITECIAGMAVAERVVRTTETSNSLSGNVSWN